MCSRKQLESTGYELIEWAPHDSEFFKSLGDYNSVILAYEAYQIFGELAEDPNAELWLTVRNRILNGKTITKDSSIMQHLIIVKSAKACFKHNFPIMVFY